MDRIARPEVKRMRIILILLVLTVKLARSRPGRWDQVRVRASSPPTARNGSSVRRARLTSRAPSTALTTRAARSAASSGGSPRPRSAAARRSAHWPKAAPAASRAPAASSSRQRGRGDRAAGREVAVEQDAGPVVDEQVDGRQRVGAVDELAEQPRDEVARPPGRLAGQLVLAAGEVVVDRPAGRLAVRDHVAQPRSPRHPVRGRARSRCRPSRPGSGAAHTRSSRAGTYLCHGVPAIGSRWCSEVSSLGATPGVPSGVGDAEAVRQGDVPLLQGVGDLDDRDRAAALGHHPQRVPAVAHAQCPGVVGADPQCAVGVAAAPRRVADDGVGGERATLARDST